MQGAHVGDMKYTELSIQTQREAPNNARTQGFAFLVRAGYITRENQPTALGRYALKHLESLSADGGEDFFSRLNIPVINNEDETFYIQRTGVLEAIHCKACGYVARSETALFAKSMPPTEERHPTEKVATPESNTIEKLANFMDISKERTAKALLYTRQSDGKFVFAVVRGDMQLSEAKLKVQIGDVKPATEEEVTAAGVAAGYASPIGLKDAIIIVDDLIPNSPNLVAGANKTGYHLKNVNYGRDYSAQYVVDLAQAEQGNACVDCGEPLSAVSADILASDGTFYFEKILHALAESHHDENGLTMPHPAAPFDVYLMNIPGKIVDTGSATIELYESLQNAGISVLLDDRDDRAGVKFNDADLIGCPVRITVGERGLQNGMVELKPRSASQKSLISLASLTSITSQAEFWNLANNSDL